MAIMSIGHIIFVMIALRLTLGTLSAMNEDFSISNLHNCAISSAILRSHLSSSFSQ